MGNKRLWQSLIFAIVLNILTAVLAFPQSPPDPESSEESEDVDEIELDRGTTITYNVTTTENVTTTSTIATTTKSHRILKNNAPTPTSEIKQVQKVAKSTTENVHTFLVSYLPGVYENVEVNKPEEDLNYERPYQSSDKKSHSKFEISTTEDPLTKLVESVFEAETEKSLPDNEAVISINPSDLDIWKIVSATRRKNGRFSSTEIPPIRIPIEIRVSHVTPATERPTPGAVKATAQLSFQPELPVHIPTKIGFHPGQPSQLVNRPAQHQTQAYQPHRPAHQQQPPVYEPNKPAFQPQQPTYQPQQPVYEPMQPAYQPQQSAYQPQQPGHQLLQPAYQPQQLPHQPHHSVNQPIQPAYQPQQSAYQPQQPVNQPIQPAYQPQQPVYQPAQPANQPIQAAYPPAQPAYRPVQPAYQPVQPVYQPIQPIYLPVQAGSQPLQATNRPTQSATATVTQNPINPGLQQTFFEGVAKLPSLVINTVENIECRLFDFCDGIDLDFLTK